MSDGCQPFHPVMQLTELPLGEREVFGRICRSCLGRTIDHRLAKEGVLLQGAGPDRMAVWLRTEPEADVTPGPQAEFMQVVVVRCQCDGLVYGEVRSARRLTVIAGRHVRLQRRSDASLVSSTAPLGRHPGNLLFDQTAKVQQLLESRPLWQQSAPDSLGRVGGPVGSDEGAAVTAPAYVHVAGRGQPSYRFPDRRPAYLQHPGQLPLAGEALTGHELTQRDRGDEPIRDPVASRADLEGLQRAATKL